MATSRFFIHHHLVTGLPRRPAGACRFPVVGWRLSPEKGQKISVALGGQLVHRDEAKRRRVDAIPQTRWLRAIRKYMAQVRVAARRTDLRAHHAQALVLHLDEVPVLDGLGEAGPTGAGVELVGRAEKRLAGHDVHVEPRLVVVPVLVSKRRLGAAFAGHVDLLGRQPLLHILIAGFCVVFHAFSLG